MLHTYDMGATRARLCYSTLSSSATMTARTQSHNCFLSHTEFGTGDISPAVTELVPSPPDARGRLSARKFTETICDASAARRLVVPFGIPSPRLAGRSLIVSTSAFRAGNWKEIAMRTGRNKNTKHVLAAAGTQRNRAASGSLHRRPLTGASVNQGADTATSSSGFNSAVRGGSISSTPHSESSDPFRAFHKEPASQPSLSAQRIAKLRHLLKSQPGPAAQPAKKRLRWYDQRPRVIMNKYYLHNYADDLKKICRRKVDEVRAGVVTRLADLFSERNVGAGTAREAEKRIVLARVVSRIPPEDVAEEPLPC